MAATGIKKEGGHFYVASGPFKCQFSASMWPCGTLKNLSTLKKKKGEEFIKHPECASSV